MDIMPFRSHTGRLPAHLCRKRTRTLEPSVLGEPGSTHDMLVEFLSLADAYAKSLSPCAETGNITHFFCANALHMEKLTLHARNGGKLVKDIQGTKIDFARAAASVGWELRVGKDLTDADVLRELGKNHYVELFVKMPEALFPIMPKQMIRNSLSPIIAVLRGMTAIQAARPGSRYVMAEIWTKHWSNQVEFSFAERTSNV